MQAKTYSNPVIPGFFPDPSIAVVGLDYYLVTSSFEYFPGVPIFHSRDLVNWQQIGHVLTRHSQVDLSGRKSSQGIYAPTIRYHDGLFYMVTTDVYGIGNFYVTAADPSGPWSDPIRLEHGNIDPSLMFDDDGKVYVTAQQGADLDSHIIQYEIDPATGRALSDPRVIFRGDGGPWAEGPHLYKTNGMYYVTCASGGTSREHRQIIARSQNPYGPFEMLSQPIMTHKDLLDHPIQNLGHADLFEDAGGNWWAVFLGVRPARGQFSVLGRETFLAPVRWTDDGWPMIDNNEGVIELHMSSDRLIAESSGAFDKWMDHFDQEALSQEWVYLRRDLSGECSLAERPGTLGLRGNAYTLNDAAPALFVSRRQQHLHMRAIVQMSFAPMQDGEEAGMAARLADFAHYEIALLREQGKRWIVARTTDRGQTGEIFRAAYESDVIYLSIESNESVYKFAYSANGTDWLTGGEADIAPLSPERNWCFTGVCLGMYATGNGKPATTSAYYDSFSYESRERME